MMTDDTPKPTAAAIRRVIAERARQHELWGKQLHDAAAWMLILGEEVGEALREANAVQFAATEGEREISRTLLCGELVQVAAVCVQIVEALS